MLAKKYRSRIISIKNPFKGIYTIEFESLKRPFKYQPGQFLHLALDADYDGSEQWPESRCFSLQSNPTNKTLTITYAVKGTFTQEMEKQLKPEMELWLKLPYGDLFQQDHNKTNTVFIAGGTGITPFLSLFTHETFREYINPKIYLGFKSIDFNIYKQELNHITNPTASIYDFYEDTDGHIKLDQIIKQTGTDVDFFISGPPAMIFSFKEILIKKGVHRNNILTDDWE